MGGLELISQIFDKLNLDELHQCRDILGNSIKQADARRNEEILSKRAEDFVTLEKGLAMDSTLYGSVFADIASLQLKAKGNSPVTKWLTLTDQSYAWQSSNGHTTVKSPVDMMNSKSIYDLMLQLNEQYKIEMNSCLVSYYPKGSVYARLHDDAEDWLDQSQPICGVSFGATRTIEFLHQGKHGRCNADYSISPEDGSLYIMLPGCQHYFRHRVKVDHKQPAGRYCLSFRKMKPADSSSPVAKPTLSSPVKQIISQIEGGIWPGSVSDSVTTVTTSPGCSVGVPPSHKSKEFANPPKRKKTTVMFGTSITLGIDHIKLGKLPDNRKFINISENGAKIRDIIKNLVEFHDNEAADDVEKIIFSLGTNDIKYSVRGVRHLKRYLIDLVVKAKSLFPGAIILFQSCLPIRNLYWYTVPNVHAFNKMIRDLCYDYNCVYINCFRDFLDDYGNDINTSLYRNWLHLNWDGKGIFCSWLKSIISKNSYNSIIDNIFG